MTEFLRSYLLSIVAVSLFSTILLSLVPSSGIHRTLKFLCGLLLLLVTISPVVELELEPLQVETVEIPAVQTASDQEDLVAELIKSQVEAYIWDKANQLGCQVEVEVEMGQTDTYAYPEKVVISGEFTEVDQDILSVDFENNLAIPIQKQEWKHHE
ncbi:MAG: hypothetical protein R3Y62_01760 [Eubacteriales bacterium]